MLNDSPFEPIIRNEPTGIREENFPFQTHSACLSLSVSLPLRHSTFTLLYGLCSTCAIWAVQNHATRSLYYIPDTALKYAYSTPGRHGWLLKFSPRGDILCTTMLFGYSQSRRYFDNFPSFFNDVKLIFTHFFQHFCPIFNQNSMIFDDFYHILRQFAFILQHFLIIFNYRNFLPNFCWFSKVILCLWPIFTHFSTLFCHFPPILCVF